MVFKLGEYVICHTEETNGRLTLGKTYIVNCISLGVHPEVQDDKGKQIFCFPIHFRYLTIEDKIKTCQSRGLCNLHL